MDKRINIETELLPCPFCGQPDRAQHLPTCWFLLRDLGAARSRLAEAWNRRATPPATGETELPPLPIPAYYDRVTARMSGEGIGFNAEQMQQFGRDAIAHYLLKQAGQEGGKA